MRLSRIELREKSRKSKKLPRIIYSLRGGFAQSPQSKNIVRFLHPIGIPHPNGKKLPLIKIRGKKIWTLK